ncbi:unnamed protein product [Mycena citricolor]|uniref:Uncharacterized protein n=1 Tax=Mycena citricolor TaxID=2018698 RepID=A0AAD2GYP5_9AGAR|nr:unnamed protein product [Mycena citricolor]
MDSQDHASHRSRFPDPWLDRGSGRLLEDLLDTLPGLRRTFQINSCPDSLLHGLALARRDTCMGRGGRPADILLAADEQRGHVQATIMDDLRNPLLGDVVQRVAIVEREADQDDIGVGVRQGPEAVVVFLPRSVPERELDRLPIDGDVRNVILEDRRNVDRGKSPLGENPEEGCFAAGTVADHDEFAAEDVAGGGWHIWAWSE